MSAASPRSTAASATSTITTSMPETAQACAMPLPIVPAPMTPTFLIVLMRSSQDEREVVIMRVDRRGRHPRPLPGRPAGFPRGRRHGGDQTPAESGAHHALSPAFRMPCRSAAFRRRRPRAAGRRLRPRAAGRLPGLSAGCGHDPRAAAEDASRQLRVCRADGRVEGSRGPGARDRHSREAAFRRRRAGEGRPAAVRDRSEAAGSAGGRRRRRGRARPRAAHAGRARGRASEAAGRAPRDRAEGSRRRGLERGARRARR